MSSIPGGRGVNAMKVSRWVNNGRYYGVRLSLKEKVNGQDVRHRHFHRSWTMVTVELGSSGAIVQPRLTPAFWRSCPELRNRQLGDWVTQNQGELCLLPLGGGRFRLNVSLRPGNFDP